MMERLVSVCCEAEPTDEVSDAGAGRCSRCKENAMFEPEGTEMNYPTQQLTREQAVELGKSGFWAELTAREIAEFQLFTEQLCMPFDVFHKAIEEALGRPVWTHEFASAGTLRAELRGDKGQPSLNEIIDLIPEDKRIIVMNS